MRIILYISIIALLSACNIGKENKELNVHKELLVYNHFKLDSNYIINEELFIETNKTIVLKDSIVFRYVTRYKMNGSIFKKSTTRREIIKNNSVYRLIGKPSHIKLFKWLSVNDDSCITFPYEYLEISEKNCYIGKVSSSIYKFRKQILYEGAASVSYYDKQFHLVKEVFNVNCFVPFYHKARVETRLIAKYTLK